MQEYVCPNDLSLLNEEAETLVSTSGKRFPILNLNEFKVPNFLDGQNKLGNKGQFSLNLYDHNRSAQIYSNYKNWLFGTFSEDENQFRSSLASKVIKGTEKRVLITGCGLGDDILPILKQTNFQAQV